MSKKKDSIKNEWVEFRNSVYETKSKSQDDFEKYINIIASGGLGITIAFFDKIVQIDKAIYLWIIVFGWLLLAVTLLINLFSHFKSVNYMELTISEINDEKYEEVFTNVEKRNKIINRFNLISLASLIIGVLAIIIFVTINLYIMSNERKPVSPQKPVPEEKGRKIPIPPTNRPSSTPKK
ncbi:hypothetical protein [Flavobacterium soyae]|uniref:hypothetical protein n=1 Tax=Flavobacterium soyae TaxID=2903098 RepID=UPI001E2EF59A|nr:hypothetical protein [Flavobacterium soyae]MCD9575699.1 hypothetical protein [Flavobacterium soyae]